MQFWLQKERKRTRQGREKRGRRGDNEEKEKEEEERDSKGKKTEETTRGEEAVLVEQPFHTVIYVCNGEAATVNQREQHHHHKASAERGARTTKKKNTKRSIANHCLRRQAPASPLAAPGNREEENKRDDK
jgi:hypothetical protein